MLDFERLRVLHAIATYGSVRAASAVLHVTTSAISQQIAKLESEVGLTLLERNGRGVRLTDAAELLVRHVDGLLVLVERAAADLEAHRGAVVGRLTVAAFATAARGLLPEALRALRAEHPRLRVELVEMEPLDALPMVARGDIDLAIAQDWRSAPLAVPAALTKAALFDDTVDIALPKGHPLARQKLIELAEVAREPWISWPRGSLCHDWLLVSLRKLGVDPEMAHVAGEHATQLALVAAGLGVCISPRLGRGTVPRGVRIAAVKPALSRQIFAVWRAEAARRPSIRALVKALRAGPRRDVARDHPKEE